MTLDALLSAEFVHLPWNHQAKEFEISAERESRALIWQMRTGKSKLVIDTACHLWQRGLISGVVLFAPSGIHANWSANELPAHMWPSVPYTEHTWLTEKCSTRAATKLSKADKAAWDIERNEWWEAYKKSLKSPALRWYIFNSESITRDDVRYIVGNATKRPFLFVADECVDFRTPGAKRTMMARAIAKRAAYKRILDGTIVTENLMHAFSQYELLERGALGFTTYAEFKEHYGVWKKVGFGRMKRETLTGYQNEDELREHMARYSSVVLRKDCEDLPDVVERVRVIPMTTEQAKVYRDVLNRAKALAVGGEVVEISKQAAQLIKLQQVASGFIIDKAGKVHEIAGATGRLDALVDEIRKTRDKVCVWAQFQEDIDRIVRKLTIEKIGFVEYHGRVADKDKARALYQIEHDSATKVLIGQPRAGGRGITIPVGLIIWYSHTISSILRQQASERATIMHGDNVGMVDFMCSPIDTYFRSTVERKISVADDIAGRGLQAVLAELDL